MVLLGCIADDFTGASDMAAFLKEGGMRTLLLNGVPKASEKTDYAADAIVIALKTRTAETKAAVSASLEALRWLEGHGCRHFYIKYCSTFDSTPEGNIGPICDAAMEYLNVDRTLICPALPVNGRTVADGNVYVHGIPLQESSMKDHPLTPMRDCNLKRLMEAQSRYTCREIGRDWHTADVESEQSSGVRCYIIPDCQTDRDAEEIVQAFGGWKLLTGGSGLAKPLARFLLENQKKEQAAELHPLLLAGSCSVATRNQIAAFQAGGGKSIQITPAQLCSPSFDTVKLWQAAEAMLTAGPVLVYSSAAPEQVEEDRRKYGDVSDKIEKTMASLAASAASSGVPGIIAAGGETSGAVTGALHQDAFWIGESIAPGVPLMVPVKNESLCLVLKSGNFGDKDFFAKALSVIEERNKWKMK